MGVWTLLYFNMFFISGTNCFIGDTVFVFIILNKINFKIIQYAQRIILVFKPRILVISSYCNFATAPSLSNANPSTPQTTIGANTTFTCSLGYESSIAPLNPYYTCQHNVAGSGTWSIVTGTCTRMILKIKYNWECFYLKINYFLNVWLNDY